MCLIFFAHECHPRYRLLLVANRDEFYDRPTRPAQFWRQRPELLAGFDEVGGGTWLGVTKSGRWSLVTNVRNRVDLDRHGSRSRGLLVTEALINGTSPRKHIAALAADLQVTAMRGFNLLLGDGKEVVWYANRDGVKPQRLVPGIYGLSNALLDSPWPKLAGGKAEFAKLFAADEPDEQQLFALLADTNLAPTQELPDTGFGPKWEKILSARFIRAPGYGTRISTQLRIGCDGQVEFVERSFDHSPDKYSEVRYRFVLQE